MIIIIATWTIAIGSIISNIVLITIFILKIKSDRKKILINNKKNLTKWLIKLSETDINFIDLTPNDRKKKFQKYRLMFSISFFFMNGIKYHQNEKEQVIIDEFLLYKIPEKNRTFLKEWIEIYLELLLFWDIQNFTKNPSVNYDINDNWKKFIDYHIITTTYMGLAINSTTISKKTFEVQKKNIKILNDLMEPYRTK